MILSGYHEPGSSVFLLVFPEGWDVKRLNAVEEVAAKVGAVVRTPRAVISRREAFSILARLLDVDDWSVKNGTELIMKFKHMRDFNARAVRDYLSMVTGWEWEIEAVGVHPDDEERVIFAKFRCSGGC